MTATHSKTLSHCATEELSEVSADVSIHPTAIVEPGAELGRGVVIGPYTLIGSRVQIGAGTKIGSHTIIEGRTTIGQDNNIGHFVALGGQPQDRKYRGEQTQLEIGDNNTIREFATVHIGTEQGGGLTRIGHGNWIMGYTHIAHDCDVEDYTTFSSNAQIAGHVRVGKFSVIGGMAGVHQWVQIGPYSMLGGSAALAQDLPPFMIAAGERAKPYGINVEGLRRHSFSEEEIGLLQTAYKVIYKSGLSITQAQEKLVQMAADVEEPCRNHLEVFHHFIIDSKRGIAR